MSNVILSDAGDVQRELDPINRDVLVGRRLEVFFDPNTDGTPSTNGKLIWHTEWLHYSGSLLRGTSLGPQIQRSIEQVLSEEFNGMPGLQLVQLIKTAFISHAMNELAPPDNQEEESTNEDESTLPPE